MSNETSVTTNPTGSSRRAVLRAGAHAAWAVPAVQVATMVPAMAHSGGNNGQHAHYSVTPTPLSVVSQGNTKTLGGKITVSNSGPLGSTVTLIFAGYKVGATEQSGVTYTLSGTGWQPSGTNSWSRIFPSGSSSSEVTVTAYANNNVGASSAQLTLTVAYSGANDQGPTSAVLIKQ